MTTGRINQVAAFSGRCLAGQASAPPSRPPKRGVFAVLVPLSPAGDNVSSVAHLTASPAKATLQKCRPQVCAPTSRSLGHHADLPTPSSRSGVGNGSAECFASLTHACIGTSFSSSLHRKRGGFAALEAAFSDPHRVVAPEGGSIPTARLQLIGVACHSSDYRATCAQVTCRRGVRAEDLARARRHPRGAKSQRCISVVKQPSLIHTSTSLLFPFALCSHNSPQEQTLEGAWRRASVRPPKSEFTHKKTHPPPRRKPMSS